MLALRTARHILQLLSQPALPKVPGQRARPLARSAPPGPSAHRYVHVVFTLPHQLAPLALQNKAEIYGLLFRASAETLLQVAAEPKHLGAEIGFFSVLHTWNQQLL